MPLRSKLALTFASLAFGAFPFDSHAIPTAPNIEASRAEAPFDVVPLGDSVYAIVRREPLGFAVNGNSLIVICDSDVVVVDTDFTRKAAGEVIAAIRRLTKKPVGVVVNTHWHDDHVMGNQAYHDAFPGAQFIAQENTLEGMKLDAVANRKQQLEQAPSGLEYFRGLIKDGKSMGGGALADDERAAWVSTVAIMQQYLDEAPTAQPVLPTITFSDSLHLARGHRVIDLKYFGPANTRGDAVVFLPKERIVATGDLVVAPIPFTFNSHIGQWNGVLDRLRALHAKTYLPGHGPVMHDDSYIRKVQGLLTSISTQTAAAVARGDSLAQARKSVDLSPFVASFAGENQLAKILFNSFVAGPAVAEAFAEAKAKTASPSAGDRDARYREVLKQVAGMDVSPDAMYDEAIRQRLKLVEPIRAAGAALFGGSPTAVEVLRRVRGDSQLVMHNPDSVMAAYTAQLARARRAIPSLFVEAPDEPLEIHPIPKEQASTSAPAAYAAASGGNRAGFLVNAYQPGGIAKMNVMMGIAHEAYPGHHFQHLYADRHHADGSAQFGNGAFVEGWGIYAEALADQVGLYDTPLSRIGYLAHLFDVFMALQIDVGIHARGWTREQAIDTMMTVAGRPEVQATQYANRHLATPGQLASYGIGFLAITGARDAASAQLGPAFKLPEFHDVVLRNGTVGLPELRRHVDEWAAAKKGSAASAASGSDDLTSAVEVLFAAMRKTDTAAVRAAFIPGGRVVPAPAAASAAMRTLSVDEFVKFASQNAPEAWIERMWNPASLVDGTLGSVWFEYDVVHAGAPPQCGFNSVQLQRTPEGWKIASMAFTSRRTDCPNHPAPASDAGTTFIMRHFRASPLARADASRSLFG